MKNSSARAKRQTAKNLLERELCHTKIMKLREKKMMEDIEKKKHFLSYKNDWIYRKDIDQEPSLSLPSVHL